MRIAIAALAASALLFGAGSAGAGSLDETCAALDQSSAVGCKIERASGGDSWSLTTNLVVGLGSKSRVVALERQFCETVVGLGVRGSVTRWSQVGSRVNGGAKMEWSCNPPAAVSAAPVWSHSRR